METTITTGKPAPTVSDASKIGLKLLPFTPVPFSGTEAMYAWGRLLGYGAIAGLTFTKHRKISYVAMSAAALSLVTSLAGGAYR
jgi:hypothetical protein